MRLARGFTLIEVMVALVIVAFGMGAVLAALSSSASNIAALREKTLAEWVAMNQIADVRLNLNAPQPGVTEGDVKDFGNANWHWRQDIIAMDEAPGMLEIAVRVQRLQPGSTSSTKSTPSTASAPKRSSSAASSGAPSSFFNSSSGSSFGSNGSSGGLLGQLNGSSGAQLKNLGAAALPKTDDKQQWIATVIGFRGDAIEAANGEQPDWSYCSSANGGLCNGASSSSGASSSGATVPSSNNGASSSGISITPTSSSTSSSGG